MQYVAYRASAVEFLFVHGELMPFPDADNAIITQEKLLDYLLNPAHPVGGPKAAWFASLGYTQRNWEQLRNDLLSVAQSCNTFNAKPSPFGVKYETEGEIGCEGYQPATVFVVWIVEENSPPRLITAYPGN
ncbi:MAG: hypothetical protein IT195_13610 [Microthrixaceae bacterium]|nr:hypothetical protein [Microthrixaceae bacterium]